MLGLGQDQGQTQQASNQLGVAPDQMHTALEAAVPLLLGQMGQNAQDPQQAASLSQALEQHDGSTLDSFQQQGQMPNMQDGQAIVGHVFGGNQQSAVNAVSQRAGISPQLAMQILSMAAPLVLGYLGRNKGSSGTVGGNLGGLGNILGSVLGGGAMSGGLGNILGGVLGGGANTQPQAQQQQGGMGDLGSILGSVLGGNQPAQSQGQQGGVGLNPINQQSSNQQQASNPLEDLIGMFGGNRR